MPRTLISQVDYNELSQVITKHLGSRDSLNFLQDVGYRYNERGWLLQSASDLFLEKLHYNQMTTVPQYNGNIASLSWDTDTLSNSFVYTYDRLNRLTSGVTADSAYAERNITYDQAGNIQTLSRVYAGNLTDSLVYNYTKNAAVTNQVQTIQDLSADPGTTGFAAGTGSYHYDPNGNMNLFSSTNPAAKTYSTTYNLLNLPNLVNSAVRSVYEYDASGEKLSLLVDTNETDYISGIQYDNNRISFIQTEEGRVFPYSTDTSNYYQYFITDHLGNTRIAFDTPKDTLKVEQKDDYLPFGMEISQGSIANPKNEYLYNKKELQEDSQLYDYGARFYDPVVGRWDVIDPITENHFDINPYNYVLNNPISYYDQFGLDTGKAPKPPNPVPAPNVTPGGGAAAIGIALNEVVITASPLARAIPIAGAGLIGWNIGWKIGTHPKEFSLGVTRFLMAIGVPARALIDPTLRSQVLDPANPDYIPFPKDLPYDKGKPPGDGWVWKGKGTPESGQGNWVNPETGQKMHPDFDHPDPKGPHWGLQQPSGEKYDLFPDGRIELNNK